jgi:hypothetical protein
MASWDEWSASIVAAGGADRAAIFGCDGSKWGGSQWEFDTQPEHVVKVAEATAGPVSCGFWFSGAGETVAQITATPDDRQATQPRLAAPNRLKLTERLRGNRDSTTDDDELLAPRQTKAASILWISANRQLRP